MSSVVAPYEGAETISLRYDGAEAAQGNNVPSGSHGFALGDGPFAGDLLLFRAMTCCRGFLRMSLVRGKSEIRTQISMKVPKCRGKEFRGKFLGEFIYTQIVN